MTAVPLCAATGGRSSRTLRPNRATKPFVPGARGNRFQHRQRLDLVVGAAVVEGHRQRLPFDVVPVDAGREGLEPLAPRQRFRLQLQAVLADVDELVEPDDSARVGSRAAADAGDERVTPVQPAELFPGRLGHRGVVWHVHDRREDPVDVEQDGRPFGLLGEPREQ